MATVDLPIEDWQTLPWKQFHRNVYRLQKRIYQAAQRGDWKRVHNLQRLLLCSWSARCLAVRQVTQDNRGKRTPGVDGVASLTPPERVALAKTLRNLSRWQVDAIRRVYIPKTSNPNELRGLGIPTMRDRAMQALVKQGLEPEWEAQFETNSYGFRPGRSIHDAIEAIFNHIRLKPKSVYDGDIEKCFDKIDREALLNKIQSPHTTKRLIQAWLEAGILDEGQLLYPEAGTPQGGVISPLLANIALHGFELAVSSVSKKHRVVVIRYADDLVILCEDLETLKQAIAKAEEWLAGMGLVIKASKSRITHTLNEYEGNVGFDFLGFHIQQYRVSKYRSHKRQSGYKTIIQPSRQAIQRHTDTIREIVRRHRGAPQAALVAALNPVIRGWAQNYRACVAKEIFKEMDRMVYDQLRHWAHFRHPRKSGGWRYTRYWRRVKGRIDFSDGTSTLARHEDTPIVRHIKVKGDQSPYDGDWVYWGKRLGRDPTKPNRVLRLLKQQRGQCEQCGLDFTTEDVMEVHHIDGNHNNNHLPNLALLHAHCHDQTHAKRCQ